MATSKDSFNFYYGTPPDEFFKTIQSVNQLTTQQCSNIFETVLVLVGNSNLVGDIDLILMSCSDKTNLDLPTLKEILRVLLIICKEARRSKLTTGQLYSDLLKLNMESGCASSFCQAWKQNFLIPKEASELITSKRLLDIEWKFGVTASSDALARVGNCYLQLKMIVAKGTDTESILMEMSIPQFYEFMHEMEKAKIEMDSNF